MLPESLSQRLKNPPLNETMPYVQTALRGLSLTGWRLRHITSCHHGALRALILSMGQNSLKTLPVWAIRAQWLGNQWLDDIEG